MIRGIWLRITFLLALAIIPATLLQLKLQKDSVAIMYELFESSDIRVALDQYLEQIREIAQENPEKEAFYRAKFGQVSLVKRALESFFMARNSIDEHLRFQMILIIVVTLITSLLGSLLISRGIIRQVKSLMDEREKSNAKLRDLNVLKNWQGVARMLVHELRAPLTPIKLIATDLERKFQTLSTEEFSNYLPDAQRLMNEQIQSIESMITGFTEFGRLPAPVLERTSIQKILGDFDATYGMSFGERVHLQADLSGVDAFAHLDPKLIRDLLFNLCKNAVEANSGKTNITIKTTSTDRAIFIRIQNTGAAIPESIRSQLFEPYASTKLGADSKNMGLGLTISRKIALDHGGDLTLLDLPSDCGVAFQLEIPSAK